MHGSAPGPAPMRQYVFRLSEEHSRLFDRVHEALGSTNRQQTLRWMLDELALPWLEENEDRGEQ